MQVRGKVKYCSQCHTKGSCRGCFAKYVHTKVVKRMDTFRGKYNPDAPRPIYLLPLSFGVSSTTLLSVLDFHLKGQMEKSGRPGYDLHVLHVDTSSSGDDGGDSGAHLLEAVKERFPGHTYSTVLLEDNLRASPEIATEADPSSEGVSPDKAKLQQLLSETTNPTARLDVLQNLLRSRIQTFATSNSISTILYSHSTTRLAEKTLSLTAKGLGSQLPLEINDSSSPSSSAINPNSNNSTTEATTPQSQYPLRDVLTKEITLYAETSDPPLTSLIRQRKSARSTVVSAKNMTIDELVRQYFETVERDYPSIVANVVRTTGKLQMPPTGSSDSAL